MTALTARGVQAQGRRPPVPDAPTDAEVRLEELSVEGDATPRGVVPAYAGGQAAAGGRLGLLGNTDIRKAPFSIASYTDRFVRDQQAATVSQALVLDPSVRATQTKGGQVDPFFIRRYRYNEGQTGEIAFDGVLTRTALAANLGDTPIGVPAVQLNIGAEYALPWAPGLTFDGNVVNTSSQFVDTGNTQSLSDWARLDIGARYTTLIDGRRSTVRAIVQNATGTNYWTGVASFGTLFQGAPRTYLLSMSVDL